MRFKMLSLSVLMMLFLASCSEQHLQEDRLGSSKVGEQKGVVKAPQDSVLALLHQARWGDGSAYLKLADCYRDGFGVKKDFFGMITMANMAESRGGINRIEDYIYDIDYYKNGGYIQLTEDDVKRLELIVQPKSIVTE